jgi:predicted TIM-barrel fold metal-dependent hydrolase
MTLDAHQHFWHFDPIRDAWITEGGKIFGDNAARFYKI